MFVICAVPNLFLARPVHKSHAMCPKMNDNRQDIALHPLQSSDSKACRLLYVVGQLGLGGLERQLLYLLQIMDRQRYKPIVVVWNYNAKDPYVHEIQALGVPVLSLGDNLSRIRKLVAFRRLVSQFQPEVVHSYCFFTNWAAWWAALGSTAIPVGSIRNSFLFDRKSTGMMLGRWCARWPRAQICNSGVAKKTAESCLTVFKPHHISVVRNRLALTTFSTQPYSHKASLLAVGNLYPRKRWDRLIKVISVLTTRRVQIQVRHVGDGPLRGDLEELARRLGVDGRIQFLGPRKDIPALLGDSSFLVHTAEDEGCPNVVMEAMACGRAVVAMDAGDVSYLVEDGKTGFVVRRGDEIRFADRVMQLLSDEDLCRRMGLKARAKAEREFGLEGLISETLEAYKVVGWQDASV
jgi:glycosyltransferase involved in cell wall biosynthesis